MQLQPVVLGSIADHDPVATPGEDVEEVVAGLGVLYPTYVSDSSSINAGEREYPEYAVLKRKVGIDVRRLRARHQTRTMSSDGRGG
jgi:hypothetical protein